MTPRSRLPPGEQAILDRLADYELGRGENTPVVEVLLDADPSDAEAVTAGLEALERKCLVELIGHNRETAALTRVGALACRQSTRLRKLGSRLLAYLRERLAAERSEFKEYTWGDLRAAGVATSEADFHALERVISIFLLSSGGSHGPVPASTARWLIPKFLVKLRQVETLEALHDLLPDLLGQNSPARSPRARLAEDVAELLGAVYKWYVTHESNTEREALFVSEHVARSLGWKPARLNRAMNLLSRRGFIDLDPRLGSTPFDAYGFELTEQGVLACEERWLDNDDASGDDEVVRRSDPDRRKVFIIHGRHIAARNAMEQYVRALGLEPLDFDEVAADLGGSSFVGDIVRDGMNRAHGIIALFTPDECAALHPTFRNKPEKPETNLASSLVLT